MSRGARRLAGVLIALGWLVLRPGDLGGPLTYAVVAGGSMAPALVDGDLIVLVRADAYVLGDVVGYRPSGAQGLIVHRIVGGDARGFELRGDARSTADADRPGAADLVGRVVLVVPHGRRVVLFSRALLPGVIAALVVLLVGRRFLQDARQGTDSD